MAAIIAGIAEVTTVVLTQIAATVDTFKLSKSAEVLQAQEVLNQHLYQASKIDLLAEEVALVRDMSLLACDARFHSLCLILYQVYDTTESEAPIQLR